MKNKKIMIVGLDGANKTTANLIGVNSPLYDFISTIPPYTPPAWTSIFTGVNPAKHGIIGWQKLENSRVKLVTSKDVKYPRLSEILENANLKSILVNLPMTYPFEGIRQKENTIIISDWASPEQKIYPEKIELKYKKYLVDPPHDWARQNDKKYPYKVKDYLLTRLNIYYDLLEKVNWNLYFIVFSELDWLSHKYPQILDGLIPTNSIKSIFKEIKKFIDYAQSIADILFIVSDHGFEIKYKIFYINDALAESGLIKWGSSRVKLINMIAKLFPSKIKKILSNVGVEKNIINNMIKISDALMVESPTWGIYVKDTTKLRIVKEILKKYEEVFDVIESKKIYKGPYLKDMPDLIVIPNKHVWFSHTLRGKIIEKTYEGEHEIHGIFAVYGDGIKENIQFERTPRVYDIVPTVLHIFDLPIPKNTDGRVLMEIFDECSEFVKRKSKFIEIHEPDMNNIRDIAKLLKSR